MHGRLPYLTYQVGAMTRWDSVFNLGVVDAPLDQVLPLIGGAYRAGEENPVVMEEGDPRHPHARHEAGEPMLHGPGGIPMGPLVTSLQVSSPRGAEHLTLVEQPFSGTIAPPYLQPVSEMAPDLMALDFRSGFENKNCFVHGMTRWLGGSAVRDVAIGRNRGVSGWEWTDIGDPLPFEETDRYTARRQGTRMDRALVFDYLRAVGVDLEAVLIQRDFVRTATLFPYDVFNPDNYTEPFTGFEAEYRQAISLGYGSETELESTADMRADARDADAAEKIRARFDKELQRAKTIDQVKVVSSDALEALGSLQDPFNVTAHVVGAAKQKAQAIDLDHAFTRELELQSDTAMQSILNEMDAAIEDDDDFSIHDALAEMAGDNGPSPDQIIALAQLSFGGAEDRVAEDRARAKQEALQAPFRQQIVDAEKSAKTPAELLRAAEGFLATDIPYSPSFKSNTMLETYLRKALDLDPDCPETKALEELFLAHGWKWWGIAETMPDDHPDVTAINKRQEAVDQILGPREGPGLSEDQVIAWGARLPHRMGDVVASLRKNAEKKRKRRAARASKKTKG